LIRREMMRLGWVIALMAAVGVALVQVRLSQNATRARMYRLEAERLRVRRRLWEQQLRLSEPIVGRPDKPWLEDWAVELTGPGSPAAGSRVARRD